MNVGRHGHPRMGPPVIAMIVGALIPSVATALPGDAPVTNVAPANGAVVTARATGIDVIYGCPVYTNIASLPNGGGRRQYGVRFAHSSTLAADGRLANPIATAGPDYFADDLPETRCRATMATSANAQVTPGTYYWQAHRLCVDCVNAYEVGPVHRFAITLAGPGVTARLAVPPTAYAGYPVLATVTAPKLPAGVTVVVQARRSGAWRRVGAGTIIGGVAKVPTLLRRGDGRLRASVQAGAGRTIRSAIRSVSVVSARTWPSGPTWVGAWHGSQPSGSSAANVSWSIVNGGRSMRNAKLRVTATCPSATAPGGFTIQILTVTAPSVRIAPNGGWVYTEASASHAVLFSGRLSGQTATGSIRVSLGPCVGSLRIVARHA